MSQEDQKADQAVDLTALDIDQLLGLFIGILAAKAWQYMGYRLDPGKKEIENLSGVELPTDQELLRYWIKDVIIYTLLSFLIFLALNEVNKDLSPELAKPLRFIVAIGVPFGALISLIHSLPRSEKGEKDFD